MLPIIRITYNRQLMYAIKTVVTDVVEPSTFGSDGTGRAQGVAGDRGMDVVGRAGWRGG